MSDEVMDRAARQWLREEGILRDGLVLFLARQENLPLPVAAAYLLQESGGGRNVYGHDVGPSGAPRPFWGHGAVTEANYEAYLVERDLYRREVRWAHLGPRSQGVGPMQLTFHAFQDSADAVGGCWSPRANMTVGFRLVRGYYDDAVSLDLPRPWWQAARRYNGKATYADEWMAKRRRLRASWRAFRRSL